MSFASSLANSDRRKMFAWAVPVVVTGALVAAAAISSASPSDATPRLANLSAAQLLVDVQTHGASALSGTVKETANLGLPSLPGGSNSASLSWQNFVAGSHEVRIWADGPQRQRSAVIGQLSEADVIHNGRDLWTYTSDANSVSHTVLAQKDQNSARHDAAAYNPTTVANEILKAVTPSTSVTVAPARTVAGRSAYTLVLTPKDAQSTVGQVRVAIDAKKFVPLDVSIYGSGSRPALDIGFTKVSFARPAASHFDFHAPAGATVTRSRFGGLSEQRERPDAGPSGAPKLAPRQPAPAAPAKPRTLGSAWTTVLEIPAGATHGPYSIGSRTVRDLTTAVSSGGARLLHTALINAVFLPDGRIFVGAVRPATLEHIAASTPN